MAFLSDAQLKAELVAVLRKTAADVPPATWDALVTAANAAAYGEIVRRLAVRGFTKAQIDTWDHGSEFERSIGLYFAVTWGAGPAGYSTDLARMLDRLDRRAELDAVAVLVGGALATPDNRTNAATVGYGPILTQATDVFAGLLDPGADPEAPRRGAKRW